MTTDQFAAILNTVVDDGRLTLGTREELENEIEFEASEQGLNEEERREAVAFAVAHYRLPDGND